MIIQDLYVKPRSGNGSGVDDALLPHDSCPISPLAESVDDRPCQAA